MAGIGHADVFQAAQPEPPRGCSRIAAYDAGLDFVGCEIDKYYFKAQEARFAAHAAQLTMWG